MHLERPPIWHPGYNACYCGAFFLCSLQYQVKFAWEWHVASILHIHCFGSQGRPAIAWLVIQIVVLLPPFKEWKRGEKPF